MDDDKSAGMDGQGSDSSDSGSDSGKKGSSRKKGGVRRKSRAQSLKKGGVGSAKPRTDEAIALFANDPYKQMAHLLHGLSRKAFTGRDREVSHLTEKRMGETLMRMIGELRHLNMPIQRIDRIGRRQVAPLVAFWVIEQKQVAATINTKVSFIRNYCELIGKVGAIPKGEEWYELMETHGVDRSALIRQQVAYGSKSWTSAGIEPIGIAGLLVESHYHESLLVELMFCFGLRVSEVLSLNPYKAAVPGGLMVTAGAKGGRDRFVPFSKDPEFADKQHDVLNRALSWVRANNRRGDMGYPGLSMEKSRQKYYNTLQAVGLTKSKLGVVSHGLRHEYAATLFEQITGHRPPVEGQEPSEWFLKNRELVDHAFIMVSEALGHWRKDIASAYLGSVARMSKTQKVRIEKLIEMIHNTQGLVQGMLDLGVERAWLTGRGGQGIQLMPRERIQLTVALKHGVGWLVLNELQALLEKLLPGRVMITPLLGGVQPDDGVEVFLD